MYLHHPYQPLPSGWHSSISPIPRIWNRAIDSWFTMPTSPWSTPTMRIPCGLTTRARINLQPRLRRNSSQHSYLPSVLKVVGECYNRVVQLCRLIGWVQERLLQSKIKDQIVLVVGRFLQQQVSRVHSLSLKMQPITYRNNSWLIAPDLMEIWVVRVVMWIKLLYTWWTRESHLHHFMPTPMDQLKAAVQMSPTLSKSEVIQKCLLTARVWAMLWHLNRFRWLSMRPIGQPTAPEYLATAQTT